MILSDVSWAKYGPISELTHVSESDIAQAMRGKVVDSPEDFGLMNGEWVLFDSDYAVSVGKNLVAVPDYAVLACEGVDDVYGEAVP